MSPAILALLALTAGEPVTLRAGTPTALEQVPVVSPGFLQEDYPAVAWGGGNFLAVWAGYGLTRARIDIGGNVLDPVGRPLWERPSLVDGAYPALIHDGSRFVLAWSSSAGVFAARLDTAGVPVDPAPVSIASGRAGAIALATSGSRHLLVWVGAPGTMLASILDPELCPAVAAPFALDSTGGLKQQPAAGFNGQSFLAAWVEDDGTFNYSLRFARIDTDGFLLDSPEKVLVANGGNAPRVASDGVNFLVVWEQPSSEPFNPVRYFAARIDAAGAILDSPLLLGGEPGFNPAPAVVFDTVNYVVTWPDRRGGTYAARVTPGGTVLDPGGFPINAGQPGRMDLAHGGGVTLAVAADGRNGNVYLRDIYGARLDTSATPLDPAGFLISRQESAQLTPALAGNATGYLAVWPDYRRTAGYDLVAARLDGAQRVLDDPPLIVAASDDEELAPRAAPLGVNWLVAWERRQSETTADLYAARINPSGNLLDPAGIAIVVDPANEYLAGMASSGSIALVVWGDNRGPGWAIRAARIDAAGTVLDPGGLTIGSSNSPSWPAVDFDGSDFLVVWTEPTTGLDVLGSRVTTAGVVRDPGGRLLRSLSSRSSVSALTHDGANHFLAWSDAGGSRIGRIDLALNWLDGVGVATGPGTGATALAFDRGRLALVTCDTSTLSLVRLLPDLTLLDTAPLPLFTRAEGQLFPFDLVSFAYAGGFAASGPAGLLTGFSATRGPILLSPRAHVLGVDTAAGCAALPHALLATTAPICENTSVSLSGALSALAECPAGPRYQWRLDGFDVPGAVAVDAMFAGLAPGPHQVAVRVACTSDPACVATSEPLALTVQPGPPAVGSTLLVARSASGLHAAWGNVSPAKAYALIAGVARSGPFRDVLGRAGDGALGLDVALPPEPLRYLRIAVEDRGCGIGPP